MLAAALLALGAASCAPPREGAATYSIESDPREVLANARDPRLVVDSAGSLFMLAVHGGAAAPALSLYVSRDGGDTFGTPVPISRDARVSSHGQNSPTLVVRPTEIYALWEQGGHGGSELMFARSITFGHSFETPVRVTDKRTPSFNGFSTLGASPSGDVFAVWLDGRDEPEPPGTFSVYAARSRDRGANFEPNVRVAKAACPCCRPAIAFGDHGEVIIAWRRTSKEYARDIALSVSRDGGTTFEPPMTIAEDRWITKGCPHSGPAIASRGEQVWIAWRTEGDARPPGLYVAVSHDGARSFGAPLKVADEVLDANHPDLSVAEDGSVVLAFEGRAREADERWAPTRSYVVKLDENGVAGPAQAAGTDAPSVAYPSVAAGGAGRVYLAWSEPGKEGRVVRLSRARAAK